MHAICTVVAYNYIAQAMALESSIKEHNPGYDFYILIVDGMSRNIEALQHANILIGDDLDIDNGIFLSLSSYYDLFEISTAVKPTLLRTLIARGYQSVTFLDPDTQVFASLAEVINRSNTTPILLTPHRLTPVGSNHHYHDEKSYLRYGIFNLGFISVNENAIEFLKWWEEKLRWSCRRYSGDVSYTDQKWIDLVPAYFQYGLVTHKGYNVAPWNLSERPLSKSNSGKIMAGDSELVFIHYSQMSSLLAQGKESDAWEKFSENHLNDKDSLDLVRQLTKEYSDQLQQNRRVVAGLDYEAKKWKKESFHLRAYRIKLDQKGVINRKWYGLFEVKIRLLFDPIIINLERFSVFNALVDGISVDLMRVYRKLFRTALK